MTLRSAEQVALEMAEEMHRRFGIRLTEIAKLWLARCIMEARHELAVEMGRADGPPHAADKVQDVYNPWDDQP